MIPDIETLAQTIYEAKKVDAWGNWKSEYRKSWPSTPKALRRAQQLNEDIGIEFAFAQAKAVHKLLTKEAP